MSSSNQPAGSGGPLQLPPDINYHCIQCGRSCAEFWEIPVESEKAEEIRQRPAGAMTGKLAPRRPVEPGERVVESPWTPGRQVMRLDERGGCVMLTEGGSCSLHAAFGYASKPNICRSFPYKFVETPRGIFTGLSFACTAVLRNEGPTVAGQRAEVADLLSWTHSRRNLGQLPELTGDIPLSWEQAEAIEADLAELLDPALGSLPRRLIAQAGYLTLLSRFLREARESAGQLTGGPEVHAQAMEIFRRRLRGDAAQPWALPLRLADRRRGSPLLRRMILGFAHGLRNTHGERRGRMKSYNMALGTYFGYAFGRGRLQLPAMKRAVTWSELGRVKFNPEQPEFDLLLTRYFRHRLFRKDLLTAEHAQLGQQLMLMHWGLIHWYSAALALDADTGQVTLEHLHEGLRNVEKFFVFHSTFDAVFSKYPLMRAFLERMFAHPLYAYSMAWGEWQARDATPAD